MKKNIFVIFSIISIITNAQNVGIGISNPQNKLHVGGGFRLDTLTGVGGSGLLWHNPNGVVYGIKFTGNSNEVLRGDGSFSAFNVNGAVGWLLNGNGGTNPATNFLGTTDDASLVFRIRNLHSGLLDSTKANASFGYRAFSQNTTGSGNSAIGYKSLFSNTTGGFNSAVGITSLYKNISGSANAAIGWEALFNNTEGSYNTAMGTRTLFMNQTGHDNVAVGESALFYNATKSGLVAVGTRALHVNTGGSQNTAVGHFALAGNTFGSENTALGYTALLANTSGGSNAAFGNKAMERNTTGSINTALGGFSLRNNTQGHSNVGVGYTALYSNTTGTLNTALGTYTLEFNTTGKENTAVGYQALYYNNVDYNSAFGSNALMDNETGYYNSAFGNNALRNNSDKWYNSAFGAEALRESNGYYNSAIGFASLRQNSIGQGNTAVGMQTMLSNTTGSYNTAIGMNAGANLPNNVTNVTTIGYNTGWITTLSNHINVGNFSVQWIGGQTGWFHYSDKRIKNDIKNDVPGLSFITRLKPITYYVDIDKQEEIANAGKIETNSELTKAVKKDWEGKYDVEKIKMTGFFAQDVEEAAKSINYTFSGVHNPKNGGLLSIDYSAFVVPLVKAVQEQQSIIEKQQKLIDELLKRVTALENK